MTTYYVINNENKIEDELEISGSDSEIISRFSAWLKEKNKLEEYLLVKRMYSGTLEVTPQVLIK